MDLFGATAVGLLTAVGGGTFRDSILLSRQPFWVVETEYLYIAITGAAVTFFAWPLCVVGPGSGLLFRVPM